MVNIVVPVRERGDDLEVFIPEIVSGIDKLLSEFCPYSIIFAENSISSDGYTVLQKIVQRYKNINITLIKTPCNAGIAGAIKQALSYCQGDMIVIICADLSDRIEDIPIMVERIIKNNADVVIANRNYSLLKGRRPWHKPKSIISFLGSLLLNCIISQDIHDYTNSFRAYRKEILVEKLKNITSSQGRDLHYLLLLNILRDKDIKIQEINSVWYERKYGRSNFSIVKDIIQYFIITVKFLLEDRKTCKKY